MAKVNEELRLVEPRPYISDTISSSLLASGRTKVRAPSSSQFKCLPWLATRQRNLETRRVQQDHGYGWSNVEAVLHLLFSLSADFL
jgi:hypothetical protein